MHNVHLSMLSELYQKIASNEIFQSVAFFNQNILFKSRNARLLTIEN